MIVQPEERREALLSKGVTKAFLDAIDNPSKFQGFKYLATFPEGFYYYLPSAISNYTILSGYEIVPIYEDGESYYVLMMKEKEFRFIHFELEQDEIYKDFGSDFRAVLINLLIEYYEFETEIPIKTLTEYGIKLGLKNSLSLFEALESAGVQQQRTTFELDKAWRKKILSRLLS